MTHDEIIKELMILRERKWTENSSEAIIEDHKNTLEAQDDYRMP